MPRDTVRRAAKPAVRQALEAFVERCLEANAELFTDFDPQWRSPCELDAPEHGRVRWRPRAREEACDFEGLENALELEIHPDIKSYYGTFWSATLEAEGPHGHVSLLLLWNQDDAARLVENLIGHALQKRRRRQPFNVFVACTEEESELYVAVDNATGEVLLEAPDGPPLRKLADDLATFISTLTPAEPLHRGTSGSI